MGEKNAFQNLDNIFKDALGTKYTDFKSKTKKLTDTVRSGAEKVYRAERNLQQKAEEGRREQQKNKDTADLTANFGILSEIYEKDVKNAENNYKTAYSVYEKQRKETEKAARFARLSELSYLATESKYGQTGDISDKIYMIRARKTAESRMLAYKDSEEKFLSYAETAKKAEEAYTKIVKEANRYHEQEKAAYKVWESKIEPNYEKARQNRKEARKRYEYKKGTLEIAEKQYRDFAQRIPEGQTYEEWANVEEMRGKSHFNMNDEREAAAYWYLQREELKADVQKAKNEYEASRENLNLSLQIQTGNADWEELKIYNPNTGDMVYDAMNGKERKATTTKEGKRQMKEEEWDKDVLLSAEKGERELFNYIYAKYGKDAAYSYIDKIYDGIIERNREEDRITWSASAEEHPYGTSALSVVLGLASIPGGLINLARTAAGEEIDLDAWYNKPALEKEAYRSTVSENIGGVGGDVYNIGMGLTDFAVELLAAKGLGKIGSVGKAGAITSKATTKKIAQAIMGGRVFSETVVLSKQKGFTDEEAIQYALMASAIEIITEKLPIDAALDAKTMKKSAWKYIRNQGLSEAGEEAASEVLNTIAEVIAAGDKSEWMQTIEKYKKKGYSQGEAIARAFGQKAIDTGISAMGGLVGGMAVGGMAVGGYKLSNTMENRKEIRTALAEQQRYQETQAERLGNIEPISAEPGAVPTIPTESMPKTVLPTAETRGEKIMLPTAAEVARTDGATPGTGYEGMVEAERILPETGVNEGGKSYSVQNIPNTRMKYVKADRQVIKGDNPTQWAEDVKNYIDTEIRKGKDVPVIAADGDILYITEDSSGKARFRNWVTRPDGTKTLMTDEEYAVKLRAEAHIDEVAEVSKRGNKTVPDKKNHPFAKDGFNYRTAYFEDLDGKYYRLTVSVGKNGEINTVYNVGKIKEAQFPNVAQRPDTESVGEHYASNSSIPQTGTESQENVTVNPFASTVLPTAEEQLEMQRREAAAAKAETETERTGILLGVPDVIIQEAKNVSKAIGTDVLFYENTDGKVENDEGYYNHEDGKIYINKNCKNPTAVILGHEIIHHIQLTKGYLKFFKTVLKKIQQDGKSLDAVRQELKKRYARNGVELKTLAQVDQDVVAEYAQEHLFTDEASIVSVVNADKESGHVIKRFLDNVLAKLGNVDARERAFVARARALYAKALRENAGIQEKLYGRDTHAENAEAHTESPAEVSATMSAKDGEKINPFRATVLPTAAERFGTRTAEEDNPSTADAVPLPLHKGGETAEVRAEKTKPEVREESTMAEEAEPERGKTTYDGMTEEEYDAMADVQEAEDSMAGHSMLYEDGRQYSIRKEKEVAKRDGKQYNKKQIKMNSQEHTLVKSAIMKKESARTGESVPKVDSVYAYDKYYLYEPASGYDGVVFARFDPIYDQRAINEIEEGLKSGTVRDKKALSGRIKAFRGGKRFGVMHNGNDENGRTSDGTAGVHGSELGSNDVGHPGGGVRNQSGVGLDQESEKREATLRLQYEQQIREDAYLSELARRRENWEIDDAVYEKLYNEYVGTNPELMEQEAKIMRAARDRARLAVTKSNESDGRQYSIGKEKGVANKEKTNYNNINNKTGGTENGRKMDNGRDRRIQTKTAGKQTGEGTHGSGEFQEGIYREGDTEGRSRSNVRYKDSEGRRISPENAEKLRGTAIVDKMGRPMAVYHFTPETDFKTFAKGDIGFHFGTQAQANKRRSDLAASSGRMFRVYLNIQNPVHLNADIMNWRANAAALRLWSDGVITEEERQEIESLWVQGKEYDSPAAVRLREILAEKRYDGIVYPNGFEGDGDSFIAFRDEQIIEKEIEDVNPDVDRKQYAMAKDADEETEAVEGAIFDGLPRKAQAELVRTERYLSERVGEILGVPKYVQRDFLQGIIRDISEDYLQSGVIDRTKADALFEEAYKQGVVVDAEYFEQYKHIRDHLRNTRLTISQEDSTNIADFSAFRKSAFGKLRIVNDGGLPVDVAYAELTDMAPELFPEDITHPAEQLQHMFEIADGIRKTEQTLDEAYGDDAETFKAAARDEFHTALNSAAADFKRVKRYAEDRSRIAEEKTAEKDIQSREALDEAYKNLKTARRNMEKVKRRLLLTEQDEMRVGQLLRGEITSMMLNPEKDNVKDILTAYRAKQEYETYAKRIREWNAKRKEGLQARAREYLANIQKWKDKPAGWRYARETMERNFRDIMGEDAEALIAEYITPVHKAQAQATRLKNEMRDRVKKINLSRKVAKGNAVSEAHAVQLLGEAEDNIAVLKVMPKDTVRDGAVLAEWEGRVAKLWAENPNLNKEKIREAVKTFREIYDTLFEQMNEARIRNGYEPVNYRRGYFPHFQSDSEGVLAQFGRALGIDTSVSALPTTINGMTHVFRPGIQWLGNTQERIGFRTVYDAVEGFDKYIEGVADVIHQTDNIQKLRALAKEIRYAASDDGIKKQIDQIEENSALSREEKDALISQIYENAKFALGNFVVELDEYTNLLANKKSRGDREMERKLGRKWYNIARRINSNVAANMVALNIPSWLSNFIPLTQAWGLVDTKYLLRGMGNTIKAYHGGDDIVSRSTFLTNRRGADPLVQIWEQGDEAKNALGKVWRGYQAVINKLSGGMEFIDAFTSDSLVRAKYYQNLDAGMSEVAAMDDADAFAAGVMADRSKGAMPTVFHETNPLKKLFTQFQLEVNNQYSYMFKDMPRSVKERGMAALAVAFAKLFLGAYIFNELYELLFGRRSATDPIDILNEASGDFTGYQVDVINAITGNGIIEKKENPGLWKGVSNLATNVGGELPFVGGALFDGGRVPVSSALPNISNVGKALLYDGWDGKKRLSTLGKEIAKPIYYTALPGGGGQLKKIFEGMSATIKGGSYSVDSQGRDILQYPVYNDTPGQAIGNALWSSLFGKNTLPTARDWVKNDFDSLGWKETAAYQGMQKMGVPGKDAYALLDELHGATKAADERKILQESTVSGAGKSVVYYGLMASEGERETMDAAEALGADMGGVTEALIRMKDAGELKGAEASNAKRDAIRESGLSDAAKKMLYRDRISDSRDDDIAAFEDAGLSFDDFLQVQNEYATINETVKGATEKATAFSRWINKQGYSAKEKKTIQEAFKFYSQIPAEAVRYDNFVNAGFSDEKAYKLTEKLNALEPEEGKEQVSSLQKQKAIVDAGLSEKEQVKAFGQIMEESEYERFTVGYDNGVTPVAYVAFKETLPQFDADKNGNYKQDEVTKALSAMGNGGYVLPKADGINRNLTNAQKAALWQMANKSWKPGKNPFDVTVGTKVYNALNAED